ncbi:hypothetical protein ACOBQX_14870 [Actinokineospora sp. G85]|uniref:hypothetical protein n=1 Tax=Actinokineospora sp. G85 TaxID=3406626 RepID=UPI003C74825C
MARSVGGCSAAGGRSATCGRSCAPLGMDLPCGRSAVCWSWAPLACGGGVPGRGWGCGGCLRGACCSAGGCCRSAGGSGGRWSRRGRCEARSCGPWSSRIGSIWPLSDMTRSMMACGAVSEASSALRRRRLGVPSSELPPYLASSSATVRCVRSGPPS